jgi:hypothetical protein
MMSSRIANPLRYLAIGLVGTLLGACGGPAEGPEEALRTWVRQGEEFAEARNRGELIDMISPNYTDARGNSRDDIGDLFRLYFLRQQKVALITRIDELEVFGGSAAKLVLSVGMAGKNEGTFGFSADAYEFEMEFELDDDEWLLTSARWAELGEELR